MKEYRMPAYPATHDVWETMRCETRPLIVYGMGNGADKLLAECEARNIRVADFMASDGFVRGQSFHGKTVLSFAAVREKYPEFVLVLAFASSRPEVLEMLWDMAGRYPLLMPDLPVAGNLCFDAVYYNANYAALAETEQLLADEPSRNLFRGILQYKLTGDIRILRDAATSPDAAWELLHPREIGTYIDCGAYTGDTLAELTALGAPLTAAVCIEPDKRNFKKLQLRAAQYPEGTVRTVCAAVWDSAATGALAGSGNRNSSLIGASYQHREEEVRLLPVDTLCDGLFPDYIKYDVEGAEKPALIGSALTIERARPKLRVSVYHRTEDMTVLPAFLKKQCVDYDFYLRRTPCVPAWETDLIAVPRERSGANLK